MIVPFLLWLLAHAALAVILWPVARSRALAFRGPASQAAALVGLGGFCVAVSCALFLLAGGFGGRPVLALLPLLTAGLMRLAARNLPAAEPRHRKSESFFVLGLAAFFVLYAFGATLLPLFQYDSLLYHLPTAALAWQQKTLFVASGHPQIGTNPVLSELPKLWAFSFSGGDFLAGASQAPYFFGLACLAFAFAKRLGCPTPLAAAAGLFVVLTPKAFDLASSGNVDLIAGFSGAASIWLLCFGSPLAAAVALVCFAQLKFTTVLPATIGAVFLAKKLWLPGRNAGAALLWCAAFAIAGGAWEWANLIRFGNPTQPYQIIAPESFVSAASAIAPRWLVAKAAENPEKWEGYYLNNLETAAENQGNGLAHHLLAWADLTAAPYDMPSGRWGLAWLLVGVPGLCLALIRLARKKWRRRRVRDADLALALAFLFCLATPKSWETRFSFLLLPFAYGAGAFLLGLAARKLPSRRALYVAIVPLLLLFCVWKLSSLHSLRTFRATGTALKFTSQDPRRFQVAELADELDRLAPASLWIHFTHEEKHYYGMSESLLYPYFSRRWNRPVTIASSGEPNGEEAAVLLAGSALGPVLEKHGYKKALENEAGAVYSKRGSPPGP